MTKNQLKMYIANAEENKTFEALKNAGADLSNIEARYNKWEVFCNKLAAEKKQFTVEEYKKYREEKDQDTKTLLKMIDVYIK